MKESNHHKGLFMCGQTIHKSKSGKLAWSDKFLAGQDIPNGQDTDQPQRSGPRDLGPFVKAAFLMFGLFVVLLVASGLHRHIIYGGN